MLLLEITGSEIEILEAYLKHKSAKVGFVDAKLTGHFRDDRASDTQAHIKLAALKGAIDDLYKYRKKDMIHCVGEALAKHNSSDNTDYGIKYINKRRKTGMAFSIRYNPDPVSKELKPTLSLLTFRDDSFLGNQNNDYVIIIK